MNIDSENINENALIIKSTSAEIKQQLDLLFDKLLQLSDENIWVGSSFERYALILKSEKISYYNFQLELESIAEMLISYCSQSDVNTKSLKGEFND
ncbi:MAG: hypothetical protein R3Y13_02565 [bacterium]